MKSNKHKVVLVGLGKMGRNHFRVLRAHRAFDFVGVVDPAVAAQQSTVEDVPVYKHLEDLADVAFDAAVVATPTAFHAELVQKLVALDKHVLVEKPLAGTPEQCHEILVAALRSKSTVAVGHIERFNPAIRKLGEVLEAGWLGDPIHFSITRVGGYPKTVLEENNVILDLAVHDIDIVQRFVGPLRVVSAVSHSSVRPDVIDTAEMLLVNDKGVSVSLHVNWITPTKIRSLRVTGTRSVCSVDYILQTCELTGGRLLDTAPVENFNFDQIVQMYQMSDRIEFGVQKEEPLKLEYDHFAKMLRDEPHGLCTLHEAAHVVELAHQAIANSVRLTHVPSNLHPSRQPRAAD